MKSFHLEITLMISFYLQKHWLFFQSPLYSHYQWHTWEWIHLSSNYTDTMCLTTVDWRLPCHMLRATSKQQQHKANLQLRATCNACYLSTFILVPATWLCFPFQRLAFRSRRIRAFKNITRTCVLRDRIHSVAVQLTKASSDPHMAGTKCQGVTGPAIK